MEFENIPEFGNAFNPAKNTSKLTTNTLIQWLPEKVTLPEDLHFDLKEFTQSVVPHPSPSLLPVWNVF